MSQKKKIKSDRICATCCGDKNSVADTEIFTEILQYTVCPSDVSPQRVAATSRPIGTHGVICRRELSPSVFRP